MTAIQAASYDIVFNESGYDALNVLLLQSNYSKIFVIVDEHTHEHCLAPFLGNLATEIPIEVIEIPHGEINKTIETCTGVWDALANLDADRKGLIFNVGGGVVTDLGGFVASTFKRGMDFINVPTSLLSMVDASVGGKTGVDLGTLKNLIGVINNPQMVLIDVGFLATLPPEELRSGLAEMYKHGLVADRVYWEKLKDLSALTTDDLSQLIYESIIIKNDIVIEDPREQNIRKALNYGHTLGHAIESYCLASEDRTTLLHGEAIAIGMILESFISVALSGLSQDELDEITATFNDMYDAVAFAKADITSIIEYLKYDKKNANGQINFVLLESIGKPVIDKQVSNDLIHEAFDYYQASTID
ncbi:3-dehydroquinate synthase [Dokdonia sp. 4H-3-7-5]|uniref:3-dehydroquinate synthase n=1 Tax=Dokdonia sp. (strain 4H-3-7-5) TaxID=983548 RepID=UPI00020A6DCC|nr:3-dehydroquinate synthase [Dokdonia sp. 4H-3-7-5]AEE20218.1 3-dehydroquinate synthase [Dokdonia sp. 4H-3-7-5]